MKHITLFEAYTKKITCEKCDHSWKIEKEDKHPYLCHTCGYDSEEKKFNHKELERFWRNYDVND
jgi:Zn finger protein HypA/HybF involved in hydrogenase expression